jgi:energy-coupling factor transport system ATP-binding protein
VLVTEPQVIILDEPTTGLDRNSYDALMEIIRDLNSRGRTIVAITHSMEAAAGFGDRILALSGGRVVYEGDKRKFFRDGALVKAANVKPTGLMEASMELNGNILLNYGEFAQCWRKK